MGVQLSGDVKILTRVRYTVWDLLGDLGGLADGLHLLLGGVMSYYASLAFEVDYLNGKHIDDSKRKNRYMERFKQAVQHVENG